MWHVGSSIFAVSCRIFSCGMPTLSCDIRFPDQGLNLNLLHWERGVLATGPPGKSLPFFFSMEGLQKHPGAHQGLLIQFLIAVVCAQVRQRYRALRAQRGCLCVHTRVDTRSPGNDGVSQKQGGVPFWSGWGLLAGWPGCSKSPQTEWA